LPKVFGDSLWEQIVLLVGSVSENILSETDRYMHGFGIFESLKQTVVTMSILSAVKRTVCFCSLILVSKA
jgi:hypothetical protein